MLHQATAASATRQLVQRQRLLVTRRSVSCSSHQQRHAQQRQAIASLGRSMDLASAIASLGATCHNTASLGSSLPRWKVYNRTISFLATSTPTVISTGTNYPNAGQKLPLVDVCASAIAEADDDGG